jgi:hypothetical protein
MSGGSGKIRDLVEERPVVSIVVATVGDTEALRVSLASALAQHEVPAEVIVVFHGSAGPIAASVEPLVADARVRCERAPNLNAAGARNFGVRGARADTIAFLDDTDVWAPRHLATMLALGGADFVYSASWIVDAQREIVGFQTVPAPDTLAIDILGHNAIGTPSSVVASRDLWERAGGFDEWLDVLAPWDLWIRWSRAGSARMSATPTVAARAGALLAPSAQRELRELKRRYGGDARRAGVRFGTLPAIVPAPADGARPPWLVEQPDTTTEPPRPTV